MKYANLEIFIKYKWASWQTETDLLGFPQTGGWWWWRRMREGKKLSLSSEVGKYSSRWWRGGVWSIPGVHEICPTLWCCGVFYKYFCSKIWFFILLQIDSEKQIWWTNDHWSEIFSTLYCSFISQSRYGVSIQTFLISPFLFLKTLVWYRVDGLWLSFNWLQAINLWFIYVITSTFWNPAELHPPW